MALGQIHFKYIYKVDRFLLKAFMNINMLWRSDKRQQIQN